MARKKFFTPAQANAMLPLVSRIVRDISELATHLRSRHQALRRSIEGMGGLDASHHDDALALERELDEGRDRMEALERELAGLGILLKDYFIGLIDFPCWKDDREVYLCWKLGEKDVSHWHEVDSGFSGRQKLRTEATTQ